MANDGTIGFVGFGEAAFHITKGLRQAGLQQFAAYDTNTHAAGLGEKIRRRAEENEVRLLESNAELTRAADWILSTVTSDQAAAAAEYFQRCAAQADRQTVAPQLFAIARLRGAGIEPAKLPAAKQ